MKKILTILSVLALGTTTGNCVLNTQIKTTNILNNEPIKYDGEDKIIDVWDFQLELVISSVYIKSTTLDNWNRIFALHDNEKLKNKIYEDISNFPYKLFFDKTDLNDLSKTLTDNFSSLISVPGHSTFGVIVTYHDAPKRVFYVNSQNSPHGFDIVEKYYKFFAPDVLKVGISPYHWEKILDTNKNKNEIFNIIAKFPQIDKSGWGGSITSENLYTLAEKIIENFDKLKTKFENSDTGWKIVTNTNGSEIEITQE